MNRIMPCCASPDTNIARPDTILDCFRRKSGRDWDLQVQGVRNGKRIMSAELPLWISVRAVLDQ